MFREGISSFLKRSATTAGLLPWWEERITSWPRGILYHYVDTEPPPFLREIALGEDRFLEQLSALRGRYHFLTWQEYKDVIASPANAQRTILLTFDDGFQSSWMIAQRLADEQRIPSVFFLNTKVLDNAYAPWPVQRFFLHSEANGKFLEPLWRSISEGQPLSPTAARKRCHECFSLERVVAPIEEGLTKFGMTPADLAQRYQLYVTSDDITSRNGLVEIGNHSHSHYILSKLNDRELESDLQSSHEILRALLGTAPESFAYPFGIPQTHFDERCLKRLRAISPYPHIFSATDNPSAMGSTIKESGRICLDKVDRKEVVAAAAGVTPRALKDWMLPRSPVRT